MIIGFTGRIGSGKDTVASIVKELYPEMNWQIKGFADKLREVASIFLGIPPEELKKQEVKEMVLGEEWSYFKLGSSIYQMRQMTVRDFLQRLGTEAIRDWLHTDSWVNALMVKYIVDDNILMVTPKNGPPYPKNFGTGKYPNWLVTDVRFLNELEAIKSKGGLVFRIIRPDNPYPVSNHASETALDGIELPTIINDGSPEQLRLRVEEVFGPILKNLGNAQSH